MNPQVHLKPVVLVIVGLLGILVVSIGVNFLSIPGIDTNWITASVSAAMQGIGMAILIAALVPSVERWVLARARGAPAADILDNEKRCEALTAALSSAGTSIVMTTRYSRRDVGQTSKSEAFVHALHSRVALQKAETYRVISLDNAAKLEHVRSLLEKYAENRKFALAVRKPIDTKGWPDLFVVADKVACVGIETPDPSENYWVRIRDKELIKRLAQMHRDRHWGTSTILKEANSRLDKKGIEAALATLRALEDECSPEWIM